MHSTKRSGYFVLSLFFFILLLGGCAALLGMKEEPTITLADIRIQNVKALEGVFIIKLRVTNPNDVPLGVRGVKCTLEIDGHELATGVSNEQQTVAAYGSTVVPVTVYASLLDLAGSVLGLMHTAEALSEEEQALPYTLQGTAIITVKNFQKEILFTSSGQLSLQGLIPPLP